MEVLVWLGLLAIGGALLASGASQRGGSPVFWFIFGFLFLILAVPCYILWAMANPKIDQTPGKAAEVPRRMTPEEADEVAFINDYKARRDAGAPISAEEEELATKILAKFREAEDRERSRRIQRLQQHHGSASASQTKETAPIAGSSDAKPPDTAEPAKNSAE